MAQEIVYYSYSLDPAVDVPGQEDIFALDPDTGVVRRLTDDSSGLDFVSDRDPAWSPDRKSLAIHRGISAGAPRIVILDPATGETRQVVGEGTSPIWLTVDRLAFLPPYGQDRILTAALEGGTTELLRVPEGGLVAGMSWHARQGLAFGYNDPGENPGMVGLLPAAAVEQALLTGVPATAADAVLLGRIATGTILPAWHPDGSCLAVSAYDPTTWDPDDTHVGILDVVNHTYRRIATPPDGLISVFPAWSPDGKRIVFCRGDADQWSELWLAEVEPATATRLTDEARARMKGSPDW